MSALRSVFRFVVVLCVPVLLGCGSESDDPRSEDPAAEAELSAGSPDAPDTAGAATVESPAEPAVLADLVNDIREGIASLATTVEEAPDSARQTAVRLYVTRQEVIEGMWGARSGGEVGPLAREVIEAEDRFHTLMEALSATPPPDSTAVAGIVDSLDRQLVEVLRAAEAEGVE